MPPKRKSDAAKADPDAENGADAGESSKKPKLAKSASKRESIPDVSKLDFSSTATTSEEKAWNVKFASWNVNGIRAWAEKNGQSYIEHENPDVFCVQETKCEDKKIPEDVKIKGYHTYWLSGDKDGYSGTGLYSKQEPLNVTYGIGDPDHDKEGRVITAEFEKYYFVTAYVPNAGRKLVRISYRMEWDPAFRNYLKGLDEKKPVIMCGDLNVAHLEIDLKNPKTNKKNPGFSQEERDGFTELLSAGFIDSYRHLYPDKAGAYTFWTYMMNARAKDVGWRLDYFVLSERLKANLCDNVIRKEVMGSDHCPIACLMHFE